MTAMNRLLSLPAAMALCVASAPPAAAGPMSPACFASPPYVAPIASAAARFHLPEALIRAVIGAESNGVVTAISPKGAMGLMQIMPRTWASLRLRYALGPDPFDACDNILAGTAYLRELLDRYGDPGFLAAYNAGPGRYEAYLSEGRPLPAETVAYVARISGKPSFDGARPAPKVEPNRYAWRAAELFVRSPRSTAQTKLAETDRAPPVTPDPPDARPDTAPIDTIFVARTGAPK